MTTIVTTDVVNGQTTDAGVVNANMTAIKTVVNGNIDNGNVNASAAIAVSKLAPSSTNGDVLKTTGGVAVWAASGAASAVPVGSGMEYWGASAPSGWLFCDGSAISRTTYSALFTAIGTTYGAGDGSTTFNIPDARGRVVVGKGTHADVDALNDNDGAALADRRPKHKHTVNDSGHVHSVPVGGDVGSSFADGDGGTTTANTNANTTGITIGPQTAGTPTDTPSFVVANRIIYTGV